MILRVHMVTLLEAVCNDLWEVLFIARLGELLCYNTVRGCVMTNLAESVIVYEIYDQFVSSCFDDGEIVSGKMIEFGIGRGRGTRQL